MNVLDFFFPKRKLSKVYPYLVPQEYLDGGVSEKCVVKNLGHNIYVCMVIDFNGRVKIVNEADLELWGMTLKQTYEKALENFETCLKKQIEKPYTGP